MKFNKIFSKVMVVILAIAILFMASSCGQSHWKITSEQWSSMKQLSTKLTDTDTLRISVSLTEDKFKEAATKSDNICLLDLESLKENYDSSRGYVDEELLNQYAWSYDTATLSADMTTLTLTLTERPRHDVVLLIHKDGTESQAYYLVEVTVPAAKGAYTSKSYEQYYAKTESNYNKYVQMGVGIAAGIGLIAVGFFTSNPVAGVSGASALISSITGGVVSSGSSIQDVLKQMAQIQLRMEELSEKIDQNHSQLMDEAIMTQALVYKELLTTTESSINDFVTNYVDTYEKANFVLEDYVKQQYYHLVQNAQTLQLKLYEQDGTLVPLFNYDGDKTATTTYTLLVSDFTNCKAFLNEHSQIVTDGFADAFTNDLLTALNNKELPTGLTQETVASYFGQVLNEQYMHDYYVANRDAVVDLVNLISEMSQHIYGKNGVGFAATMYDRLQYMFNFAGEAKESFNLVAANYISLLDQMVSQAEMASKYTQVDYFSILDDAQKARDAIQELNNTVQASDDNYSFIMQKTISGSLYQSQIDQEYSGKKNFVVTHTFYKYTNSTYGIDGLPKHVEIDQDTFASINKLSTGDLGRLSTRMDLLKELGYVSQDVDFMNYLTQNQVFDDEALKTYNELSGGNSDYYRILTDLTTKVLNSGDTGLKLMAFHRGDSDADYFTLGGKTTYLSRGDDNNWNGKKYVGEWVSAETGRNTVSDILDAYARYDESHWYWLSDEHWAFSFDTRTTIFFMISCL